MQYQNSIGGTGWLFKIETKQNKKNIWDNVCLCVWVLDV